MEGIQSVALFEEKVVISPRDLANQKINIHASLLAKLADKMEAKCSLHGWVMPNTIKILSRSMGYLENGRFTGDLVFHVQAEAKVLNPPSGSHIVCEVIGNNMMGMYVGYKVGIREMDKKSKAVTVTYVDAIKVILPRDLHIGDEEFSKIKIGDNVNVEIKKSRFQVNDKYILSVGVFEGKVGSDYVPPTVAEVVEAPVVEEGPSGVAAERLETFEKRETEAEKEARIAAGVVLDTNLPPLEPVGAPSFVVEESPNTAPSAGFGDLFVSGEPIYFNAAKTKEYRELDNRVPATFTLDGQEWRSAEHYIQAMKFPTLPDYQKQIRDAPTASAAMKLGEDSSKPVRADWNEQRDSILRKAVFAKFDQNEALKKILLDTYPRPLIFADAKDSYLGYGRTKMGQNKLGITLVDYRRLRTGMEALDG